MSVKPLTKQDIEEISRLREAFFEGSYDVASAMTPDDAKRLGDEVLSLADASGATVQLLRQMKSDAAW